MPLVRTKYKYSLDRIVPDVGKLVALNFSPRLLTEPDRTRSCAGRIDQRIEFGYAKQEQIARLFRRFYKTTPPLETTPSSISINSGEQEQEQEATLERQAEAFAEILGGGPVAAAAGQERQQQPLSMAAVQGHLLVYTGDAAGALRDAGLLLVADRDAGREAEEGLEPGGA